MGRGDKNGADGAAVEGMRMAFESVNIRGEIVIGEGELDEAPMLYVGEKVGSGFGPSFDIAVDPLDGTSLIARSSKCNSCNCDGKSGAACSRLRTLIWRRS